MPDRIIRDELLESDRWVSLKDNGDRLAFIACLLSVDTLGNMEASNGRLRRLWRDFGISTDQLVAKTLAELGDHDLIRVYEHDSKRYLHIPRFKQTRRYLGRLCPLSPWTTSEDKQKIINFSRSAHAAQSALALSAHSLGVGVGVGVGVGEERRGVGVGVAASTPMASEETSLNSKASEKEFAKANPIRSDETLEEYGTRLRELKAVAVKGTP